MDRRLDIQGLRGIAVIAVILFHFDIPPISGGFIGVDIFFVISGYLMTGIILGQIQDGRFAYRDFCIRRIKRLFPALFATAVGVFLAGLTLFAAFDFERLSAVSILAPLGLSNFYFWAEAGYFDADAIRKPLLHTWSLAVEIQFYLIWPVLMVLGARLGRLGPVLLIVAVAILSCFASLWFMGVSPVSAFFLMPLRGYEFCLGGMAFLGQPYVPRSALLKHSLYALALAVVVVCFVAYNKLTPFPGVAALPVVLATGVLLWVGTASFLSKAVSNRVLCALGDVSYSAYLVHWPIVVFGFYILQRPPEPAETAGLLALVALGTAALFFIVEQPLRRGTHVFLTAWRASIAVVMVAFALPLHAWGTGGWPGRGPDALYSLNTLDMEAMEKFLWPYFLNLQRQQDYADDPQNIRPNVLIIGDSQAADYVNVLAALDAEKTVDLITRSVWTTCNIPYLAGGMLKTFLEEDNPYSIKDPNLLTKCPEMMDLATSGPAFEKADAIVLAFAWRDVSLAVMSASFQQLAARTDAQIYAVSNKTFKRSPVQLANQLGTTQGLSGYAYKNIRSWTPPTNAVIAAEPEVEMIDILSMLCAQNACHMLNDKGRPLLWDETHFTQWGVEFVADKGGQAGLMPFVK
ncbi:acyltransferase [Sulfitobacter sp. S0837]|uniref:acyltransferase family protein n=1 Tax=Sulfitobacter maritimus TaxID=2741719 RepID=UPI0015827DB5|nr:acyltransferase [Sulfitobacter maritimus]NUH63728.1 acyltransferase [Sulfitobacter maritimus]NUH63798.1 acyltransferase [Sulfitobacter maritimus]NUH65575.1 acyltransferase [Sulfitobacter maritimus]